MLILTKHAQQNIVRDHLDLAWIEAADRDPKVDGAQVDWRFGGFAVLRRDRAVKGFDERKGHLGEDAKLRRPYPAGAARERRQRGYDLPALLRVSPFSDSVLDGGSVLRRDEAHRDQRFDLREAVLVQLRRPLGNKHDAQTARGRRLQGYWRHAPCGRTAGPARGLAARTDGPRR